MSDGLYAVRKDRKARISRLLKMLEHKDEYENLSALIAQYCLTEGVSMRTVKEDYLPLLKAAGKFKE